MPKKYIDADLCKMLGATCIAIRLTSTGELFPILSLDAIPSADVVSREVVEQIKWERDIAIKQLEDAGLRFCGERRTDGDC